MKNAHGRTCKKTKVYIYLYISLYENLFENGCIYIYNGLRQNAKIFCRLVQRVKRCEPQVIVDSAG